jgi:hypothetical protein
LAWFTVEQSRQETGMDESCFELCVGESIRLNGQILTVMDIHDGEVTLRIDDADECESSEAFGSHDLMQRSPR